MNTRRLELTGSELYEFRIQKSSFIIETSTVDSGLDLIGNLPAESHFVVKAYLRAVAYLPEDRVKIGLMAWADPIVWLLVAGAFMFLVIYGVLYIARLLYKANKVLDLQLRAKQDKTNSESD